MKTTIKTFVIISMMLFTTMAHAQVKVEMDVKSAAQVTYNTGVAALHENAIKDTVKLSRKRNDSIAVMATTITGLKTVYHNARRNVTGFKRESAIYKQIYAKATAIIPKVTTATTQVLKNPLSAGQTIDNIMKIQRSLISLGQQFSQIVANGHVDNPLKKDDRQSDGYNFLSSRDRYMLASAILTDLNRLDWQLTIIIYAAKQKATTMKILPYVDYKTYTTLWETKTIANRTIRRIKDFKLSDLGL